MLAILRCLELYGGGWRLVCGETNPRRRCNGFSLVVDVFRSGGCAGAADPGQDCVREDIEGQLTFHGYMPADGETQRSLAIAVGPGQQPRAVFLWALPLIALGAAPLSLPVRTTSGRPSV